MAKFLIKLIKAYQYGLSPMLGNNCRFYPSCSSYAMSAITHYGPLKGGWMSLRRISRCHPWHAGGVDHVPEPTEKTH